MYLVLLWKKENGSLSKTHQVKNIKFLVPVSPREITELDAELECRDSGEFTTLKATLSANGERYTKLSIILK